MKKPLLSSPLTHVRTSSYNVIVDLPDHPDTTLIAHGISGSFDVVNAAAATLLRSPGVLSETELSSVSSETLQGLMRSGYLTSLAPEEELALFRRYADRWHRILKRRRPTYMVVPTVDCNLRCTYCYQAAPCDRDQGLDLWTLRMERPMAERIAQAILRIDARHFQPGEGPPRYIKFYGGEPLRVANKGVIATLLEKLSKDGLSRFSAVTNAIELPHYRDLLGPRGIDSLQVTLDGPPREHDRRRVFKGGGGTFAIIARHVTMALEWGVTVDLRINTDAENLALLPELAALVDAEGWLEHPNFRPYISRIHQGKSEFAEGRLLGAAAFCAEVEALRADYPILRRFSDEGQALTSKLLRAWRENLPPMEYTRPVHCDAHKGSYIFDSAGNVYACWENITEHQERVGRLHEDGELELDIPSLERWHGRSVATVQKCSVCAYALFCGGKCVMRTSPVPNDLLDASCDQFQEVFVASAARAYKEYQNCAQPSQTCKSTVPIFPVPLLDDFRERAVTAADTS